MAVPKRKGITPRAIWIYNEADGTYSPWDGGGSVEGGATEAKQDAIITAINNSGSGICYRYVDQALSTTYKYWGFKEVDGENWKIIRKDLTTKSFRYVIGTVDYSTNWSNRETLIYTY